MTTMNSLRHASAAGLRVFAGVALALAITTTAMAQTAASTPAPAAAAPAKKNLAPGFVGLRPDDKVLLMPVDVELFSLSAGGVAEPKADWTASAQQHMKTAIAAKQAGWRLVMQEMSEAGADEFAEQVGLHAAVAGSIALHHAVGGVWSLPTKAGVLDWSFADAMTPLAQKTGARYALFTWVRDSYASPERKAMMIGLALLGVGITGGLQIGYASLVDLDSGQVVWFNRLARGHGDLREAGPARDSIDLLLADFPAQ